MFYPITELTINYKVVKSRLWLNQNLNLLARKTDSLNYKLTCKFHVAACEFSNTR